MSQITKDNVINHDLSTVRFAYPLDQPLIGLMLDSDLFSPKRNYMQGEETTPPSWVGLFISIRTSYTKKSLVILDESVGGLYGQRAAFLEPAEELIFAFFHHI